MSTHASKTGIYTPLKFVLAEFTSRRSIECRLPYHPRFTVIKFNLILFFFQNYWGSECCPCRSCSDALVPSFKQVQHSVKFLHIWHYYLLIMFICYPESYSWLGYRLLDKKHSHYIMFGKLRKLSARNKINWKDKKFEINSV